MKNTKWDGYIEYSCIEFGGPSKQWLAFEMVKTIFFMKIQLSPGVPFLQILVIFGNEG